MKTNLTKLINNGFVRTSIKKVFMLSVLACLSLLVQAQTPPFYNNSSGTSYNAFPLNTTASNKVQWIYDPGIFNSNGATGTPAYAGLITKVYWRLGTTANASSTYTNFTIKLGQTVGTQTVWTSTTYATGMTTVFNQSSFQLAGAAPTSWVMVTLQTPFVYDPTKSLVFELSVTGGTGNQSAQITNNGSRRIWGPSTNPTNGSSFGTGLVNFGFDLVPLNIDVLSVTYPSVICEKEIVPVQIEIENTDVVPRNNFLIQYKINNVVKSTETHANFIGAGQTATYVFNVPVDNNVPGNFVLTANVLGKTAFVQQNYTVNPSPLGSFVKQGTPFTGSFRSGDAQDPDIVAYGDEIRYEIEPPTGYTNSDFGTSWNFDFYEMVTVNGTSAGSSHTKIDPAGSNNGYSKFIPLIGQSDSTYIVRYAIHSLSNGCNAPVIERRVFVAPRPVAAYSATSACEGAPLQFTNTSTISSGGITFMWHFGDGDSSDKVNPLHTYKVAGTYTVDLVVTSNYDYTTVSSQQITIFENPSAEFAVTNVCEGNVTPFADASIIPAGTPAYTWNFGDGSALGSGPNPTHQYSTPGTYIVTMTVSANGCSNTTTASTTYAPHAVPDFNAGNVECNNKAVSFTNESTLLFGSMGSFWNFGDNTNATVFSPDHAYLAFGSIDVTLTVTTNFGCVSQVTKTITLKEGPRANFTITNLCDKDDVLFTNTGVEPAGATTTYEWDFSDGMHFMTKDVSRSFAATGAYQITLTAFSNNGCVDVKTLSFNLDEEPVPSFFANNVCAGNQMSFQNLSMGNQGNFSSAWDFGGGLTSNVQDPSVLLPVGSHDVKLTVTTPGGCTADITKTVQVHVNPTVATLEVESAQTGQGQMNLIASVTPANVKYTILWGDGGRSTGNASGGSILQTYTYLGDGTYPVLLNLDNNSCLLSASESASVSRTGLTKLSDLKLNVYPNPGNGLFNLDLNEVGTENIRIAVHAVDGRSIQNKVVVNGTVALLDMHAEPAGIYLISVTTENGVYTTRVTLSK